jgi:hypothetical protein
MMTKKAAVKAKPAAKKPAVKQREISTQAAKRVPGRPFVKGESGNPKGRPPKGESLTDVLKMVMGEEGKILAAEKLLALALGKGRQKPYFPALKYLFDRTDGEPVKAIQAAIEAADLPVVLLREKQPVQEGEEQA